MSGRHAPVLVRAATGPDRLELFLVSAVLCIAVTRAFLAATGFPQVGSGGLHLAHVLWGGLGMLVGQLLSLLFLGPRALRLAAIVGGLGFGLFIDEVGKFVTRDNNYFYEPVAAIIYGTFVATWLVGRVGVHRRPLTDHERLVNQLDALAGAAATTPPDEMRAGRWDRTPTVGGQPAAPLGQRLTRSDPGRLRARLSPLRDGLNRPRARLNRRLSARTVLTVTSLFVVFAIGRPLVLLSRDATVGNQVYVAAASTALLLTVVGLVRWHAGQRAPALRLVAAALLLQLLVGQLFWLLDNEFAGFPLVALNLLLLVRIRALARTARCTGTRPKSPAAG
ncbi:hypothetical protein MRQ36_26140 [Micromonospora sp. R77]|uniref:hypothetical protein n=1 Tax=Micromonospora sp. R77 TaxID=2925836 RepID=UPI001F60B001|nr:hypothetical protein [Micromonospora sp. R77]MCI4065842.1 hypothetical protein [Micromonospora sp. R77]